MQVETKAKAKTKLSVTIEIECNSRSAAWGQLFWLLRKIALDLSLAQVSTRLGKEGYPMSVTQVRRIEARGARDEAELTKMLGLLQSWSDRLIVKRLALDGTAIDLNAIDESVTNSSVLGD